MQAKLLRVLETGEIEADGGGRPERINVRVIATSTRRLLNLARTGALREDLYYRLNVLPIYVPPLRERPDDITPLVASCIARFAAEARKPVDAISSEALALLKSCSWPDNVRGLENAVYRAVTLAESPTLQPVDFPQITALMSGRAAALDLTQNLSLASAPVHIDFAISRRKQTEGPGLIPDRFLTEDGEVIPLAALERELIVFAIGKYSGRMARIARALGIGRSTLYRKLRDYGLEGGVDSDAA
jgi:DNA-binding NtrC family response regulator